MKVSSLSRELSIKIKESNSSVNVLIGKSGSGKQHILTCANKDIESMTILVRGSTVVQENYSCLYEGLRHCIENELKLNQKIQPLIIKYAKLLPHFGKYLVPIFELSNSGLTTNYIERSGLTAETTPNPQIFDFIRKITSGRPVVFICEEAHFLDAGTWSGLTHLG